VAHFGKVAFGGAVRLGEEGMMGADVNFTFRLEKLAADLGEPFCISASAAQEFGEALPVEQIAGEHTIKGFPGVHTIHRPLWTGLDPARGD
jgi:class 3 adenylate cyclase